MTFIQQIFIVHLQYSRHCSRCWNDKIISGFKIDLPGYSVDNGLGGGGRCEKAKIDGFV